MLNNEDQQPITENNKVLLWNSAANACEYLTLTEDVKRIFKLVEVDENIESLPATGKAVSSEIPVSTEKDLAGTSILVSTGDESEKFAWNHSNTLLLLEEYRSRIPQFRDPKSKKKTLWEEIAHIMQDKGYFVNADALDRKMRNMKATYRTISDNNNKKKTTGKGRINWEYYNYFVNMFKEDKTINLPASMLSSTIIDQGPSFSDDSSNGNLEISCNEGSTKSTDGNTPLASPSCETERTQICNMATPTILDGKASQAKRLDKYRKRQLEIEENKLIELKKIRESIEENNKLQKEKLELFRQIMSTNGI